MADNEYYYTEFPDIQGLIKQLDLMNENINKAVREGLNKGADIILAEQRRLAPYNLSHYISKSHIYVTKNGTLGIETGYLIDAFNGDAVKENGQEFKPGLVGMTFEFGRPGNSSTFRKNKYRYYHRYSKKRAEKTGGTGLEVFKGLKGTIQPIPHIRRGFDNVVEQAAQAVIDAISSEIDKLGD